MMAHKILIVDDEIQLLKLTELFLKREGYETTTAIDGEEALVRAREECPDLILLDIRLPKMDGFEVFKRLHGDSKTAKIPVIFATADASINLPETTKTLKASDYLLKPYQMQEMRSKVKEHLK